MTKPEQSGHEQAVFSAETEKRKPVEIITAKGSVYKYLPDGRTQRYKTATQELSLPQDVLVFIPPWDSIKERALRIRPDIFEGIKSESAFEQLILKFAQIDGHNMVVYNGDRKVITSNAEAAMASDVLLAFIDAQEANKSFLLRVSPDPVIGHLTFDTRVFTDEEGRSMRELHIGNKVTEIKYAE